MLQRAAVIQPQADNARHTVGTAVMHRAVVDHVGQAPAVARTVLLHADHTADSGVFHVLVVAVLGVVIACGVIHRAVEAAHGGTVEQVGHILVGLVLTDHTADYGIVHVAVVAIDKPFSGGGVAYNAGIGVVAGNAAQVARGFLCSFGGAAAQGNRQLVFVKTVRVYSGVTARAVTHGIHTAQVGKGCVFRCDLARVAFNAVLQLGDHLVNAGFAAAKPSLDFLDRFLCTQTAAAGDFARVRPGNAAHKAEFGNDGAAVFCADKAVLNCAAVAPDNTAHMAGIVQLGFYILAGLHVGDAQHIDAYILHGAARNGGIVYARHTADGIAHLGCARRGKGGIGNVRPQLPRRKDAVLQGAVVYARNAAQGAIFFKFLGHVQRDLYIINSSDSSAVFVLPCRAAKGDICGGQVKGKGVVCQRAAVCVVVPADGFFVQARNAAHHGSTALQGGFLYGNTLNGAVVDSRHSAHIGRAALDGAAIHLHGADGAAFAVDRGHAARIAVFTGGFCAYGGIFNIARVLPGHAARIARCGVNRAGIAARRYNGVLRIAAHGGACVLVGAHSEGIFCCAVLHAAEVFARQPAGSFVALHAAALYGDALHNSVDAVLPHSAARVAAAGGNGDILQGAALHRALVCARHTADSFAALHGDDAIGDTLNRAVLRVKTYHAADILVTADGDIVGCAGLDRTRVDARNAADVLVARLARA